MSRWARTGTIVAGMAWAGVALTPGTAAAGPDTTGAGVREGEVLVIRSAGQPVRRLRVLSVSTVPDGPTLVDVEDAESSARYTIPLQALGMAERDTAGGTVVASATPPAAPKPAAPEPPAPEPPRAAVVPPPVGVPAPQTLAGRPGPRVTQPIPRPMPTTVTATRSADGGGVRVAAEPARPAEYTTMYAPSGGLGPRSTPAALAQSRMAVAAVSPPVAATPPTPMPQAAPTAGLPQQFQRHPLAMATVAPGTGWPRMSAPASTPWPRPTGWNPPAAAETAATDAASQPPPMAAEHPMAVWSRQAATLRTGPAEPRPNPVLARSEPRSTEDDLIPLPSELVRKLQFDPNPAPESDPTAVTVAAQQPATTPLPMPPSKPLAALPQASSARMPPQASTQNPSVSPAALAAHTRPETSDVRQVSLSAPARNDVWAGIPMDARMSAEVGPWLGELKTALRPSVREVAASALVNGRYASRPQVKAALAAAAMTDPAASVRAHCVGLLTRLGYHEPDYVRHLQAAAGSDSAEVRTAARLALARLAPR